MHVGVFTSIGGPAALLNRGYTISHPYNGAFLRLARQKNWGEGVPICMALRHGWHTPPPYPHPTAMCEIVLNLRAPKSSWRTLWKLYTLRKLEYHRTVPGGP